MNKNGTKNTLTCFLLLLDQYHHYLLLLVIVMNMKLLNGIKVFVPSADENKN